MVIMAIFLRHDGSILTIHGAIATHADCCRCQLCAGCAPDVIRATFGSVNDATCPDCDPEWNASFDLDFVRAWPTCQWSYTPPPALPCCDFAGTFYCYINCTITIVAGDVVVHVWAQTKSSGVSASYGTYTKTIAGVNPISCDSIGSIPRLFGHSAGTCDFSNSTCSLSIPP